MKASEFIAEAYSLSGVLDPEDEVPKAYAAKGIFWFNLLIERWSSLPGCIMFLDNLRFPTVAGRHEYTVSLLPDADVHSAPITLLSTANVEQNGIPYPLVQVFEPVQNAQSYATVSGRPGTIYLRDSELATHVFLYPTPTEGYIANLLVKSRRQRVEDFEELIEIIPRAQTAYLYELGALLANAWQVPLPQQIENDREDFVNEFLGVNSIGTHVNRDAGLSSPMVGWNFNNNGFNR